MLSQFKNLFVPTINSKDSLAFAVESNAPRDVEMLLQNKEADLSEWENDFDNWEQYFFETTNDETAINVISASKQEIKASRDIIEHAISHGMHKVICKLTPTLPTTMSRNTIEEIATQIMEECSYDTFLAFHTSLPNTLKTFLPQTKIFELSLNCEVKDEAIRLKLAEELKQANLIDIQKTLFMAIKVGSLRLTKYLLDCLKATDKISTLQKMFSKKLTPLQYAIVNRQYAIVEVLNEYMEIDYSCLIYAISIFDAVLVTYCLSKFACEMNSSHDNCDYATPLIAACSFGKAKDNDIKQIIQLLLLYGAEINLRKKELNPPVYHAVINNKFTAYEALLNANAKIDYKDLDIPSCHTNARLTGSLIALAAIHGNVDILKSLLNTNKMSRQEKIELVNQVIDKSKNMTLPNFLFVKYGDTRADIVRVLLNSGLVNLNEWQWYKNFDGNRENRRIILLSFVTQAPQLAVSSIYKAQQATVKDFWPPKNEEPAPSTDNLAMVVYRPANRN